MDSNTLRTHLVDLLKGTAGAMLTAACLAALNYLGAHIPELLQAATTAAGGVVAVKTGRA
jgi:hypothetical protein